MEGCYLIGGCIRVRQPVVIVIASVFTKGQKSIGIDEDLRVSATEISSLLFPQLLGHQRASAMLLLAAALVGIGNAIQAPPTRTNVVPDKNGAAHLIRIQVTEGLSRGTV